MYKLLVTVVSDDDANVLVLEYNLREHAEIAAIILEEAGKTPPYTLFQVLRLYR